MKDSRHFSRLVCNPRTGYKSMIVEKFLVLLVTTDTPTGLIFPRVLV